MTGPKEKETIHICARCGKPMFYAEKSMLYFYEVKEQQGKVRPIKDVAYNLCHECANYILLIVGEEFKKNKKEEANTGNASLDGMDCNDMDCDDYESCVDCEKAWLYKKEKQ